jgi:hypothetical protein
MFNDVDETLRQLLIADVPINPAEVDISFERPSREWSSRLTGPTLNVFLFDIRERVEMRDDSWQITNRANGKATQERPPRRIDLSYMVTAWAREPADEHRILGRVLASLYRNYQVPAPQLQGYLANSKVPVLLRIMSSDHVMKPVDFWGVMDNELRTSLTWVATAPLEVFMPHTGPMVTLRDLGVGPLGDATERRTVLIGGVLRVKDSDDGVAGATIRMDGHPAVHTDGSGHFRIANAPDGKVKVAIETADVRLRPRCGRRCWRALGSCNPGYDRPVRELIRARGGKRERGPGQSRQSNNEGKKRRQLSKCHANLCGRRVHRSPERGQNRGQLPGRQQGDIMPHARNLVIGDAPVS